MKKYIFLMLGLISLDALAKYFAENFLSGEIFLIPGIFSLYYVQNTGIAFSIPVTGMLLKILTLVLISGIFWYYWKEEKPKNSPLLNMGYVLIFAGAIGNAWERIFRGYVTDFLALEYFAVFNLADSYISIGAACILYFYLKIEHGSHRT